MGIDMRQAVALAEFAHPVCRAVRVHGAAVLLREDKALILVEFAQPQPLGVLPCAISAEKLHCLCRKRNIAVRRGRLRSILIDPAIRGIQNVVADMDAVLLKVNGAPFQAQQFPAPCASQQKQVCQRFPFQRLLFERVADRRDLLRLEVVYFFLGNLRKRGLCRDVEGNLAFLLRLVKNRRDQPVMLQNRLCRQAGTGALVLPRLSERRIEAVQMVCTQIFQLDMADSRIDALGQLLVADDRGVLRSALLTYSQYGSNFWRLSVVTPALHSFSKVAANASAFFRALLSVHVGETSNVAVHGFRCFPSGPRPRWTRME